MKRVQRLTLLSLFLAFDYIEVYIRVWDDDNDPWKGR